MWTHDSIGLGEDGPTHQPVEHLAALRAIPGLDVVRPADANETAAAWGQILTNATGPTALGLTRQPVPTLDRKKHGKASGVAKGAYVLVEESEPGSPDVILVATGSEVQLAVQAAERLEKSRIATRVVSMPCREWFERQSRAYQDKVLPPAVRARVSVEAGVSMGWHDIVGDAGRTISLEHFGASADYKTLFRSSGSPPRPSSRPRRTRSRPQDAATHAPGITETNPRKRDSSGDTDVSSSGRTATKTAATTSNKGK